MAGADLCVGVERLVIGMLDTNVYIVSDGQSVMVVDPACDAGAIMDALGGRSLDAILVTHHHADHTGAAAELRRATGAVVIASATEAPLLREPKKVGSSPIPLPEPCEVDYEVSHGDIVQVGAMPWKAICTPGHSKGSMCLYLAPQVAPNPEGAPVLVSGDTLFQGAIGRTDFEGGSMDDMRASLKRLAVLPDDTVVLPGHGSPTTIGAERQRVFARFGDGE